MQDVLLASFQAVAIYQSGQLAPSAAKDDLESPQGLETSHTDFRAVLFSQSPPPTGIRF